VGNSKLPVLPSPNSTPSALSCLRVQVGVPDQSPLRPHDKHLFVSSICRVNIAANADAIVGHAIPCSQSQAMSGAKSNITAASRNMLPAHCPPSRSQPVLAEAVRCMIFCAVPGRSVPHLAFSADTSHSRKCSVRMRARAWCARYRWPPDTSSPALAHSPSSFIASPIACPSCGQRLVSNGRR